MVTHFFVAHLLAFFPRVFSKSVLSTEKSIKSCEAGNPQKRCFFLDSVAKSNIRTLGLKTVSFLALALGLRHSGSRQKNSPFFALGTKLLFRYYLLSISPATIANMASLLTNAQNAYSKKDNSTMSNAASVRCLSVHLEWQLDFLNSQIHGSATHAMEVLVAGTETALFDSRVLTIKGVEIDGKATSFTVGEENAALGSCITVSIPENLRAQGSKFQVSFQYSTSKEAPAIQW